MTASWHIQSPTTASGAIAIIQIAGSCAEVEDALEMLHLPLLRPGQVRLADLLSIDRGVVARWSDQSIHLFPHGGSAVVRAIARALREAGLKEGVEEDDYGAAFPEAVSTLEADVLHALARTASPLAIDLLLEQPRRWRDHALPDPAEPRHRLLNRLIDPPLVVAIGPSNVGKSSLLNALAGRGISLVADEPGTTRDHVGALIDMAGLVVRYVDTPGVRPDAVETETEAVELAAAVARSAELIISCGDIRHPPLPSPPGVPTLTVALRCDLGIPDFPHEAAISVVEARGLAEVVALVRERLVPDSAYNDPRPWYFRRGFQPV
jgi:hypothetical protein